MIETWIFAGQTFSIVEPTSEDGCWRVLINGALLMDRQGKKPSRLQIHAMAFIQ